MTNHSQNCAMHAHLAYIYAASSAQQTTLATLQVWKFPLKAATV